MSLPIALSTLPSTYFATDIEIVLLSFCVKSNMLLNQSFQIKKLAAIADNLAISKKDQAYVFQGLMRHGILYSLATDASKDYINPEANYYLHSEKIIQTLITSHPELVIGTKLFKFDIDGELFDGGFITTQKQVFGSALHRIKAKFGVSDEGSIYLHSFMRIYECIGVSDGRDFFAQKQLGGYKTTIDGPTSNQPLNKKFVIPRYVVLENKNNEMVRDFSRVCVCIS